MYGGYREVKKGEESSNLLASTRAATGVSQAQPTKASGIRGLSRLSGASTQPVRTKDLFEELREAYDDIDKSASKKPTSLHEDDALTWDKQSLPKGLEWMKPTPSKVKSSSANTIPETVTVLHRRDVNHFQAGLLATAEGLNSSSRSVSTTTNVSVNDVPKNDSIVSEAHLSLGSRTIDEVDKENIFTPFKANRNSESELHLQHDLFSSIKRCAPSETGLDNILAKNMPILSSVEKEALFTPLKRGTLDSIPASVKKMTIESATKPGLSGVDHAIHGVKAPDAHNMPSNLRKSPPQTLNIPHASLLTPVTPLTHLAASSTVTTNSGREITIVSEAEMDRATLLAVPLNPISESSLETPAKMSSHVISHPSEFKSAASYGHSLMSGENNVMAEEKIGVRNNFITPVKQPLLTSTPLLKSILPVPVSSCTPVVKPRPYPMMVSTPRPVPKNVVSSVDMPPPSQEIQKPVKASPESLNSGLSQSMGTNSLGRRSTNDQVFVNGKPYTVLSLLGKGGSSVVYQVLEPVSSKLLAVKCVNLSELDQTTYEGYLNEIRLLAQLQDSDCVIRMFDHQHCKEDKLLYVVMEKGETDLSNLIKDVNRTKKVSPAMAVYYWMEMLNAVSFIHKRGTIHSDLKPANFLLVSGRLKLIDFGIASAIQGDMTSVLKDNMTGTYNYISPEALCSTGSGPDGKNMRFKISYKSDVWSLGCILYSLVYGHTPFQTITNQFLKMTAITNPKHKIPYPPAPGCPRALLQAMQACLVRDPKLRPSVEDLLKYPYLGSVEPTINEGLQGFIHQINAVVSSADSASDKLNSIQSLLSLYQKKGNN